MEVHPPPLPPSLLRRLLVFCGLAGLSSSITGYVTGNESVAGRLSLNQTWPSLNQTRPGGAQMMAAESVGIRLGSIQIRPSWVGMRSSVHQTWPRLKQSRPSVNQSRPSAGFLARVVFRDPPIFLPQQKKAAQKAAFFLFLS